MRSPVEMDCRKGLPKPRDQSYNYSSLSLGLPEGSFHDGPHASGSHFAIGMPGATETLQPWTSSYLSSTKNCTG